MNMFFFMKYIALMLCFVFFSPVDMGVVWRCRITAFAQIDEASGLEEFGSRRAGW